MIFLSFNFKEIKAIIICLKRNPENPTSQKIYVLKKNLCATCEVLISVLQSK